MVTLNFTLIVELGLFLLFMWGTNRFIIQRILRVMDDREHYIEQQENRAAVDAELAEAQEARYAQALRDMHQEAEQRFRDARRAALDEQAEALARQRKQADRAIAIAREEAAIHAREQRVMYKDVAPELARTIMERVGLGRPVR